MNDQAGRPSNGNGGEWSNLSHGLAMLAKKGHELDAEGPPSCIVVTAQFYGEEIYHFGGGPDCTPERMQYMLARAAVAALIEAGWTVIPPMPAPAAETHIHPPGCGCPPE